MTEPHTTSRLHGHPSSQQTFLDALTSGRMPHAWLLAGPIGIGKATFAHLAARAILSGEPTLKHDPSVPAHHRIAEGNETALTILRRSLNEKTGKLRSNISVEEVRALKRGLTFAATESSWRVIIVDPAEDMNPSAANALLKVLEEPPERVVFFLISHTPRRLMPTILSRCRRLDFSPLDERDLATAYEDAAGEPAPEAIIAAARGSVGAALSLTADGGTALQEAIAAVLAPLPDRVDRVALHALADTAAAAGKDDAFRTVTKLITDLAARMATCAAGTDALPAGYERLAPIATKNSASIWANTTEEIVSVTERTLALNLDRRQALLDMVARIEKVAKGAASHVGR